VISRYWRGVARPECASAYVEHLRNDTLPALRGIDGFVDASVLRRVVPEGIEFVVITQWVSLAAIEKFAGSDTERAIVPDKAQRMLTEFDARARHYEVVER
jgi:heme-degrading monooxygenase HmoA